MKRTLTPLTLSAARTLVLGSTIIISFLILSLGSVALAGETNYGGNYGGSSNFSASAQLTGSAEVPPVSTTTTGTFTLDSGLKYLLSVYNGKKITAAHLHCAPAGQNGPVVVNLYEMSAMDVNGALAAGTINNQHIYPAGADCSTPIHNTADLKQAIANGVIYVNVHSTHYPNGVVRGQLSASNYNPGGDYHDKHKKDDKHHGYDHNKKHGYDKKDDTHYGYDDKKHDKNDSYNRDYDRKDTKKSDDKHYGMKDYGKDKKDHKDKKEEPKKHDKDDKYAKKDRDYPKYDDKHDKDYAYDKKHDKKDYKQHAYNDDKKRDSYTHKDDGKKDYNKSNRSNVNASDIRAEINSKISAKIKVGLGY